MNVDTQFRSLDAPLRSPARAIDAASANTREQRALGRILLAGAACSAIWDMRQVLPQADDAYISYRYAKNLVDGHGLVFNVGERVEGITNLLWTLWIAIGMSLGMKPETAAHLLALGSDLALLFLSYAYARRALPPERGWLAGLAPWIVWSSAAFGVWSPSGLETPLFAALTTATLLAADRGYRVLAPVCALAATLTRPEGGIVASVVLVQLAWPRSAGWKQRLLPVAIYGAGVLAVTAFRIAYYGDIVPNTFHAKVGALPLWNGIFYNWHFFEVGPALLVVPLVFALRERRAWAGAAFAGLMLAYTAWVRGDAFAHSRLLLPVLPVLAGLAVLGVGRAWASHSKLGLLLATSLVSTIIFQFDGSQASFVVVVLTASAAVWLWYSRPKGWAAWLGSLVYVPIALLTVLRNFAAPVNGLPQPLDVKTRAETIWQATDTDHWSEEHNRYLAEALLQAMPDVQLVATIAIGVTGYTLSHVKVLDMVGLTDPVIARSREPLPEGVFLLPGHQRSNASYVLSRKPDVILPGGRDLLLPARKDILDHPRLRRDYVEMPEVPGAWRRMDR
jgi:hypothetical protein